jgi:hypothetical protein
MTLYRAIPDSTPDRIRWFLAMVDRGPYCWTWQGRTQYGYGLLYLDGVVLRAHRVAFHWFVGPLDRLLTIDHRCRVRSCVRPQHLEAVTLAENGSRGLLASLPGRALRRARCQAEVAARNDEHPPSVSGTG